MPWWQLCTLLAFSQPASWGSQLECISINRCALLKVHLWNFFPSGWSYPQPYFPWKRPVRFMSLSKESLSQSIAVLLFLQPVILNGSALGLIGLVLYIPGQLNTRVNTIYFQCSNLLIASLIEYFLYLLDEAKETISSLPTWKLLQFAIEYYKLGGLSPQCWMADSCGISDVYLCKTLFFTALITLVTSL